MRVQRVAVVYDDTARPETTGVYCLRALRQLAEAEHFLPSELGRVPRQGFDLYLRIDDGLAGPWPADLRPSAWWAIDTHLNLGWCLQAAGSFGHVFAAQRDGAEALRGSGAGALWLPLACDPDVHRRREAANEYDWCFVGNLFPGPRQELLGLLKERFPRCFVGRCYFEEMARVYSASRLAFNRGIRNDVNMRVFEAAACGSLLLTNDLADNGQEELFRAGEHLATYRDAGELLDRAAYYLAHEGPRERIAAAGRAHALAEHTYRHRMERLLAEVERAGSRVTVPVPTPPSPDASPAPGPLPATVAPAPGDGRDPWYFEFDRPELVALVPAAARRVLDIGCGAGRMGAALKARQAVAVVGVEMDERAASAARARLDEVVVGDAEGLSFEPGSFDAVICGDVLEHLRDPAALLRRVRGWLRPGGLLVASIPNVRHHSVLRGLLRGDWSYEPAGLLDRDHLRFFTRREVEKLLYRCGFSAPSMQALPGPGDRELRAGRPAGEVAVGGLRVAGLSPAEAEEFFAYQYLVTATPAPDPGHGLTSLVILTHNQLACTRLCVDSIRQRTDEPCELVFVDNASTDGTPEYLAGVPGARLIRNAENRGFPAAANQGIRAARGRQVLLLNNDTVVTTGWLGRLLRALHADPRIGLAGPCSNRVSGAQQVPAGYESLEELDGFAWDWGRARDGRLEDTDRLVGFCLLIRREVVERVGLLDERFGLGCFDDDDYCLRALRAGYRAVIARDAFVHHFGGQTFRSAGVDFAGLMRRNRELFEAKWADRGTAASRPPSDPPPAPPAAPGSYSLRAPAGGGGLRLGRKEVRLSLCMIVRDNAGTLGAALESIRPWVDEMVVVDTGSTDDTPQIAARLGARVFHFLWCDDFSAARNESLRHARGRWVFWMDSDDTIDPDRGRRLRELACQEGDPSVLGYVVQVHCPGPGDEGHSDVTVVDHVKLFRNLPGLRFEGRIHEQVLPAIRRLGGAVAWTDLFVTHSGYDHSPEGQKRKLERDLRLLHKEHQERGEHPFTLFNLGMTYADTGAFREAANYLRRSIARSGPDESHLRKAYALLVYSLGKLGEHEEAREACAEGLALFPEDPELTFRRAMLLHERGELQESARTYLALLAARPERHFTSVDRGILGFKARHNLAHVYGDLGDLGRAEEQWRLVTEEAPRFRAGWLGLGETLLRGGRHEDALALAERLAGDDALRPTALLLRGRVAEARGKLDEARGLLREAAEASPGDPEPLQALCRLLFECGDPADAEGPLRELVRLQPADAAAHHNLGTACLRRGLFEEAAAAYRESLRHRPGAAGTHLQLGHALWGAGRPDEARSAWGEALRLDPGSVEARQALERADSAGETQPGSPT
jgi:GT2 family glycosyltransferase/tetratricopeptide (TPR) repeat protein/2-polyprenyl-3-methyl-5-hydroxy-6-metoxy-1,4-benzoquinol methylase